MNSERDTNEYHGGGYALNVQLCESNGFAYDEYDEEDLDCTHCGGTGYREVDDPLWDDCDEFGEGPCASCRGTGLRKHQTVF